MGIAIRPRSGGSRRKCQHDGVAITSAHREDEWAIGHGPIGEATHVALASLGLRLAITSISHISLDLAAASRFCERVHAVFVPTPPPPPPVLLQPPQWPLSVPSCGSYMCTVSDVPGASAWALRPHKSAADFPPLGADSAGSFFYRPRADLSVCLGPALRLRADVLL